MVDDLLEGVVEGAAEFVGEGLVYAGVGDADSFKNKKKTIIIVTMIALIIIAVLLYNYYSMY
jgi:hypothetical protein